MSIALAAVGGKEKLLANIVAASQAGGPWQRQLQRVKSMLPLLTPPIKLYISFPEVPNAGTLGEMITAVGRWAVSVDPGFDAIWRPGGEPKTMWVLKNGMILVDDCVYHH